MISKIDKVTNSMFEYGFNEFFQSFHEYKRKWLIGRVYLKIGVDKDEIDLEPITFEQMKKPMLIFLSLNAIALFIFFAEILIFRWLKWRNRK